MHHGLNSVFVATDANAEALEQLVSAIKGQEAAGGQGQADGGGRDLHVLTYTSHSRVNGTAIRPSLHAPLEEQAICALAHTAVLNRRSTFSERIRLLRKRGGGDGTDLWW